MIARSTIKKTVFYPIAIMLELAVLPFLLVLALGIRSGVFLRLQPKTLFIGMMHTNNMVYVARAMRQRGYYVQVVPWVIPTHEQDIIPYDINLQRALPYFYRSFPGQYLLTYGVFIWSLLKFRVFLLPFRTRILERTPLLKWAEIPLLRLAGKKVILNTYGADVATPRLRRRHDLKYSLYDGYLADPQYRSYNERTIALNTKVAEAQANFIISAIDHVDYLDRVDAYFHLRCIDDQTIKPHYGTNNKVPVFVHAPNHRLLKGTDKIIEVIDMLNREGVACELRIVENTSNSELLKIIADSDAVIDQLLLGTYARLAIEAMALGKPVFCFLRKDLYQFNPIWSDCPIINTDPDNLEERLRSFIGSSKIEQEEIGRLGRSYVERYHSLEYVGARFDQIIEDVLSK